MNNNIINGGLNIGSECIGNHCAIPITATTTNLVNNNLLSSNPPPNANVHYPGTSRLGNSLLDMPGINYYKGTSINNGPFKIQVAGKKGCKNQVCNPDVCHCQDCDCKKSCEKYNKIINPETGRKVLITSKKGKSIINRYIKMINI